MLLDHAVDLVVGQLHGLDGVLQGADLHLRKREDEDDLGWWPRPALPCGGPCPCPPLLARGQASRLWLGLPSSGPLGQGLS